MQKNKYHKFLASWVGYRESSSQSGIEYDLVKYRQKRRLNREGCGGLKSIVSMPHTEAPEQIKSNTAKQFLSVKGVLGIQTRTTVTGQEAQFVFMARPVELSLIPLSQSGSRG